MTADLEITLFMMVFSCLLLALFFYVVFGQVTVKRLRKNEATKEFLGTQFVSGWDIINTAQSIALPRWIGAKLSASPISFLYADAKVIDANTSKVDKVLGFITYWLLMSSALAFIALMVASRLGAFD